MATNISSGAPVAAPVAADAGDLPSLLLVDASNVIVEAVKWAEEGDAFVVRMYEAGRASIRATLTLNVPVTSVAVTNLLEEKAEPLPVKDGRVTLDFRPFEIKTLRCGV